MNKCFVLILSSLFWTCGPGAGTETYNALTNSDKSKFDKYMILGKEVYATNCLNCHQEDGMGLRGLIPPLSGSDYLDQSQDDIPCLLVLGSKDTLVVNGVIYPPQMPALHITNLELAEVITYINNTWSNEYGFVRVKDVDGLLRNCN